MQILCIEKKKRKKKELILSARVVYATGGKVSVGCQGRYPDGEEFPIEKMRSFPLWKRTQRMQRVYWNVTRD